MTVSGKPVTVRITGEAFVPGPAGALFTDWQTLSGKATSLAVSRHITTSRPRVSSTWACSRRPGWPPARP